jgi:hypothetical protein
MKTRIEMRALSVLLAVMLVSMVVPAVSAQSASIGNDELLSTYRVTDLSNPITLNDLGKMRENVINEYRQRTGTSIPIILADPEVPEDAAIVAYGFTIDAHGVPVQYVGIAGDEKSVSIIQNKAQEWYRINCIESRNAVLEQTETLDRSSWVEISRDTADYYLNPYGGVTNNFELRQLSNDGDNTKDWFAIKQIFAMEPGVQAYSSSWTNKKGTMLHDWSAGTFGNAQLYDWDPMGTITGTQSISVSITGGTGGASASWGWSYTQPDVTTYDQSSTGTEKAKWQMNFNSDASKRTTGGMKPGSTCSLSDTWNIYYQY